MDLAYESQYVAPLHSHRDAVKRLTGVRSVPAIDDPNTGVAMAESANIIAYLDATYGGVDGPPLRCDAAACELPARGR